MATEENSYDDFAYNGPYWSDDEMKKMFPDGAPPWFVNSMPLWIPRSTDAIAEIYRKKEFCRYSIIGWYHKKYPPTGGVPSGYYTLTPELYFDDLMYAFYIWSKLKRFPWDWENNIYIPKEYSVKTILSFSSIKIFTFSVLLILFLSLVYSKFILLISIPIYLFCKSLFFDEMRGNSACGNFCFRKEGGKFMKWVILMNKRRIPLSRRIDLEIMNVIPKSPYSPDTLIGLNRRMRR